MKKKIQKLCILLGILFLAGTTFMSVCYGFTIGNAIALISGILLLGLGWVFPNLPHYMKKIIFFLISLSCFLFLVITSIVIIKGSRQTVNFHEDALIVLGCGIRGESLLPTLQSRLDKGLEYHTQNPSALIIVSGGQGRNENISEAEAMKRYLIQKGVPPSRIIKEERSRNTHENFLYSKKRLDSLFCEKPYTLACVTSDYHAFRAKHIAAQYGLDVHSFNAGIKWYLRPSAYCREALSICKYWIFG